MVLLGVNIDHVATIRQARKGCEPDPVAAAAIAELYGADSITVHLREDRRHIQDRDIRILNDTLKTRMNFEMAATDEMQKIALEIRPHSCCIVPEKREEITTEGGLDVVLQADRLVDFINPLVESGIMVSLFINPVLKQVEAAAKTGAQYIELHTGQYAEAFNTAEEAMALRTLQEAAAFAENIGLSVNAGHGLNYQNVKKILSIKNFEELNIGHSIISRAVLVGLGQAVKDMKDLINVCSVC